MGREKTTICILTVLTPSHFRFSRSLRPGSDPPQQRSAASTSGAGAAGEIRGHPSPRAPPEWPPPPAADRERRRRGVQIQIRWAGVDEIAPTTMAGAVSALFLLDIKGRVLVWRDYRGDVSALQAERFFTKLLDKEVSDRSSPPGLTCCLLLRSVWPWC